MLSQNRMFYIKARNVVYVATTTKTWVLLSLTLNMLQSPHITTINEARICFPEKIMEITVMIIHPVVWSYGEFSMFKSTFKMTSALLFCPAHISIEGLCDT